MWTPKIEARVVQDLRAEPGDEVLEIGTGSGYLTALLAQPRRGVTSVEIDPRLAAEAAREARARGIATSHLRGGDGGARLGQGAGTTRSCSPDRTPVLPDAFLRQLKPGRTACSPSSATPR